MNLLNCLSSCSSWQPFLWWSRTWSIRAQTLQSSSRSSTVGFVRAHCTVTSIYTI